MIIAIDGPAGTGKSALAKRIAQQHNFFLLNSGLFYRAITYLALEQGIDYHDIQKCIDLAENTTIETTDDQCLVNGYNLLPYLRSDKVDKIVASLSEIIEIREILNEKMRIQASKQHVVCEGRDMTTIVFPHADIKIYLDASPHVRALRRFNESCSDLSLDEIEKNIQTRDDIDKNKPVGALRKADDAHYIDSSQLTLDEVYDTVENIIGQFRKVGA
jgi:cytidylate kinase